MKEYVEVPPVQEAPNQAVSEQFLRSFASRWSEAWNSHDTDRVLELLDPEIVWDDTVFWPRILKGHAEVREYTDSIWKVMPDVRFEEIQFFSAAEDGRALFLFEQSGSAPPKYGASNRFRTTGCDIFLGFHDGRLSHYLAQYEIVDMMRQYGALPARQGKIGGSYLRSLMHFNGFSTDPAR